jgi:hypothetical protein
LADSGADCGADLLGVKPVRAAPDFENRASGLYSHNRSGTGGVALAAASLGGTALNLIKKE